LVQTQNKEDFQTPAKFALGVFLTKSNQKKEDKKKGATKKGSKQPYKKLFQKLGNKKQYF
jgi:hypothetical protein